MLSSFIKVGDRVEITLRRDDAIDKTYVSLVENILNGTELDLDVPISFGRIVVLKPGDMYQMLFFTENGNYAFNASIERHFKEDGFNLMRVRLTSDGEKVQRREFYRYECRLPLKYAKVPENDSVKPDRTLYEGIIRDISGGGLKFAANETINEGSMIKCAFVLDGELIAVNAKVLHKDDNKAGSHKFLYRVQFMKIALADQERIVKYIFLEQRKSLGRVYGNAE